MSTSTTEAVLTHDTEPRGYRICRCHGCGHGSRCTPGNDFYTHMTDADPKPLYCEQCVVPKGAIELDLRRYQSKVQS